MIKKICLCILDGFAFGDKNCSYNAFYSTDTHNIDSITSRFPNTEIATSGRAVGLDDGQMGNSEIGHMTIGSGKVILQDLPMINNAIQSNISENPAILEIKDYLIQNPKSDVHILGLYSSGGVHSHFSHIDYFANLFSQYCNVKLHIFTDGRDVPPNQFISHDYNKLETLSSSSNNIQISTISGRYYAMDRNLAWERTKLASDAIIFGQSVNEFTSLGDFISQVSCANITDEFITPHVQNGYHGIKDGDVVISLNFRPDRMRQIIRILSRDHNIYQDRHFPKIDITTIMKYYDSFSGRVVFKKSNIDETLPNIYSNLSLTQVKIAETEKYPHVTFFLNGGKEDLLQGEERILIPSPRVETYDLKPDMSIDGVCNAAIDKMQNAKTDIIIMNIANGDMVGHTGNFEAAKEAVRHIDHWVGKLADSAIENDYILVITADHGNIEEMVDKDGNIHTQHTLGPVPFIICGKEFENKKLNFISNGSLANIAATILKLANIKIDNKMEASLC